MKGEIIYEYGKHPVNWGRLKNPDFSYTEKNLSCGEEIAIDFMLGENDTIKEIGFTAEGRLVTIAAMSLLSEELEDKPLANITEFTKEDILGLLETETLSPRRLKSAMLGLLAVNNAYRKRIGETAMDFGDLMETD